VASESNVATLVPTKSDAEVAAEFKKRAIEVYERSGWARVSPTACKAIALTACRSCEIAS
jgi:hypothetical protein